MKNHEATWHDAFKRVITTMQNDLQYLADKGQVSDRFIAKQNRMIQTLIQCYNQSLKDAEFYSTYLHENRETFRIENTRLKNRIICFEAICIIHGIIDFPVWLCKGKHLLTDEALTLNKTGSIRLSYRLNEKIKALPPDERLTLEHIYYTYKRAHMQHDKIIKK